MTSRSRFLAAPDFPHRPACRSDRHGATKIWSDGGDGHVVQFEHPLASGAADAADAWSATAAG